MTRLLKDLKWKPLADGRQNQRLTLFHKIHAVNLNFKENFGLNYVSRVTRAGSLLNSEGEYQSVKLSRPGANKTPLFKSAIIRTIPAWNSLPGSVSSSASTVSLKSAIAGGRCSLISELLLLEICWLTTGQDKTRSPLPTVTKIWQHQNSRFSATLKNVS